MQHPDFLLLFTFSLSEVAGVPVGDVITAAHGHHGGLLIGGAQPVAGASALGNALRRNQNLAVGAEIAIESITSCKKKVEKSNFGVIEAIYRNLI